MIPMMKISVMILRANCASPPWVQVFQWASQSMLPLPKRGYCQSFTDDEWLIPVAFGTCSLLIEILDKNIEYTKWLIFKWIQTFYRSNQLSLSFKHKDVHNSKVRFNCVPKAMLYKRSYPPHSMALCIHRKTHKHKHFHLPCDVAPRMLCPYCLCKTFKKA